jgi:hypothetical protein
VEVARGGPADQRREDVHAGDEPDDDRDDESDQTVLEEAKGVHAGVSSPGSV